MYKLSQRSLSKLDGVHPDLVRVVNRAIQISAVDFAITEGVRSVERQAALLKAGASRTMRSKHILGAEGYGRAVDVAAYVAGEIRWDWPLYPIIASAMKSAAAEIGVKIIWGGDWKKFRDGPHFELG